MCLLDVTFENLDGSAIYHAYLAMLLLLTHYKIK